MPDLFSEPDVQMSKKDFDTMIEKLVTSFSLLNWIWLRGEGRAGIFTESASVERFGVTRMRDFSLLIFNI